jgi:hypothetical protein
MGRLLLVYTLYRESGKAAFWPRLWKVWKVPPSKLLPEKHSKRQATQHGCLPRKIKLIQRDKKEEILVEEYGEKNEIRKRIEKKVRDGTLGWRGLNIESKNSWFDYMTIGSYYLCHLITLLYLYVVRNTFYTVGMW